MNTPPTDVHQGLRDKLRDAICFRIGLEIEDAMTSNIAKDSRKAIIGEVLPNARFTLSRLTTEELQNDRCVEHQIESAARIARGFVDRIRAQRRRTQ